LKKCVKNYEKSPEKKIIMSQIQNIISLYYDDKFSKKIIPHYNAFYVFYNEKIIDVKKQINVESPTCDYFVRIPNENTNKINKELTKKP